MSMTKVLVLNGPNLSRLDLREKSYYGDISYSDIEQICHQGAKEFNFDVEIKQSNDESELIGWLHAAADSKTPVIFNPAAFTHYSYAIRDAAELVKAPLIEVHLSNPLAREEFRHTSVISGIAKGTVAGFGPHSYALALTALKALIR